MKRERTINRTINTHTQRMSFAELVALCEKVDAEASHSEKQRIFLNHFKSHKGDANDLYLLTKLILAKEVRILHS